MKIMYTMTLAVFVGCSALTLSPSDFSWPIESEVQADRTGMVHEERYHLRFSIKPLLFAEFQDSTNVRGKSIRIIRDREGYYYMTGPRFRHVYVFEQKPAGLSESVKILVKESGLRSPAFNNRAPYIQLLDARDKPVLLTRYGIQTPRAEKGESR